MMLNWSSFRIVPGLIAWFFHSTSAVAQGPDNLPGLPLGVEAEYRSSEGTLADSRDKSVFHYFGDLMKASFNGLGKREDLCALDESEGPQTLTKALYVDPQSKHWILKPEAMDDGQYDGYEFISPILATPEDRQNYMKIFEQLFRDQKLVPGRSSSVHVTIDVSSLMPHADQPGGLNRLVDTMIFIENHWPELYSAVNPGRYQARVNKFAVPLAANQKTLLQKLADLPVHLRTYQNVKIMFALAHLDEGKLTGGSLTRAWKYRAANYGKLFGVGRSFLPVIEFRISDLTSPNDLRRTLALFEAVVQRGADIEPGAKFADPFSAVTEGTSRPGYLKELDHEIEKATPAKLKSLLFSLRLDPRGYSFFGKPLLPESPAVNDAEISECLGQSYTAPRPD